MCTKQLQMPTICALYKLFTGDANQSVRMYVVHIPDHIFALTTLRNIFWEEKKQNQSFIQIINWITAHLNVVTHAVTHNF